jgi:hypothetical protein
MTSIGTARERRGRDPSLNRAATLVVVRPDSRAAVVAGAVFTVGPLMGISFRSRRRVRYRIRVPPLAALEEAGAELDLEVLAGDLTSVGRR